MGILGKRRSYYRVALYCWGTITYWIDCQFISSYGLGCEKIR